ncbi:hypothetical protein, partial [Mesorhizobium sp. M4B.F.Ca.ET.013.02.1.1]
MAEGRNQEILERRRAGETFAAIARDFGISQPRVRQVFEREEKRELRRRELAEADRRPDQPNPLQLEPRLRAMLAEFYGKADFTPDDIEALEFSRSNFACIGFNAADWRTLVKWMALAGKK